MVDAVRHPPDELGREVREQHDQDPRRNDDPCRDAPPRSSVGLREQTGRDDDEDREGRVVPAATTEVDDAAERDHEASALVARPFAGAAVDDGQPQLAAQHPQREEHRQRLAGVVREPDVRLVVGEVVGEEGVEPGHHGGRQGAEAELAAP